MFSLLYQVTFSPTSPVSLPKIGNTSIDISFNFLSNPIAIGLLALLGFLVLLVISLQVLRLILRKRRIIPKEFQKQVLQVLVPKESLEEEDGNTGDSQEKIREAISVAETFFSAIGGLKPQKGFRTWLYGREDHLSCEIVSMHGSISFFVACPTYLLGFVEQQIQAQYPEAQIELVEDYNFFNPSGYVFGNVIKFDRQHYFPIKTYQELETDPLNALTSSLSQIPKEDGAVIQFVIRAADKRWSAMGRKIASAMKQGKNLSQAQREVSGNFFTKMFSGSGAKKKDDSQPKPTYQLSPLEEEMVKRLETKSSKAGMDANVRVIVSARDQDTARAYMDNIIGAFAQFSIYEYGNSFKTQQPRQQAKLIEDYIFRSFNKKQKLIVNTEEMASLFHFPLPQTETTNIRRLEAKRAPAPLTVPTEGVLLGYNEYRGKKTAIRIKREDRRRHMYVIGKSGSGKSVLLSNMALQDIQNGEGVCVIDPHGDLIDDIIVGIPPERAQDVVLFDPSDTEFPLGMNLLEFDPRYPEQKTFVINEMIKVFDKLYDLKATGGPIFEQYMRNAMLLIMDDVESGSTLMEISKVLSDEDFRKYKVSKCKNQVVIDFWTKEAEKAGGEAALANMVPYITSKLTQFISNDVMRPIIGQQNSAFNFRDLMDNQKILLVKLSKGKIGELNAYLLGLVIVSKILMAALSRTDMNKADRKDFYLYIDEFQNFTTDSIAVILSEARKYLLNLIIAHQYVGQLVKNNDTTIKDAVFGNVGTIASFKIGPEDAELFAKEFAPVFNEYDVLNVEQYNCYLKLLVDNQTLKPFNVRGLPPPTGGNPETIKMIVELTRQRFGRPRQEIETEILQRAKATVAPAKDDPFKDPFSGM